MTAAASSSSISTLDVLLAARKLIESPENWTQGALSKTPDGALHISRVHRDACAYCINGAIFAAAGAKEKGGFPLAAHIAINAVERFCGISSKYNDTHTHAEVLAMLDLAIAASRTEDPIRSAQRE